MFKNDRETTVRNLTREILHLFREHLDGEIYFGVTITDNSDACFLSNVHNNPEMMLDLARNLTMLAEAQMDGTINEMAEVEIVSGFVNDKLN